ncbi:hypothetical protein FZEAL_3840 [Fusarium zealandicum]|uniref:Chromo domain-containing protein n=1 Tax=Fusarium zealandicum TaxID=1053134 RepID=A0A8H4UNR2_9HYPO|nr:hypothetical protein FZEAL_3840 [Fusarium zealandicum]
MEELTPGDVGLDQLETLSITSTIDTEHDTDEEWTVEDVLAEYNIKGETKYLIRWEGYELWEASWEPEENLNDDLMKTWEDKKVRNHHVRAMNTAIRDWRKASIERFTGKFARHAARNQKRVARGLEPTSYHSTLEEQIEYLDLYPVGDEPDEIASSCSPSVVSDVKASITMGGEAHSPSELDHSTLTTKTDEDHVPTNSRRHSAISVQNSSRSKDAPASSIATKKAPRRQPGSGLKGVEVSRPQVIRTSSSLANKFGRPKQPNHGSTTGPLTARKSQKPQEFISNVFAGGRTGKKRAGLLEAIDDPTRAPKMLKLRHAWMVEKGQRDREGAVAPSKKPAVLFSLDPADRRTIGQTVPEQVSSPHDDIPANGPASLASESDAVEQQGGLSSNNQNMTQSKKKKKSISWGPIEETKIPLGGEPMELDDEESLFIPEPHQSSTTENIDSKKGIVTVPTVQSNPPTRRVRWDPELSTADSDMRSVPRSITKLVQFGIGAQPEISVVFEGLPVQIGLPWLPVLENESILLFTHTVLMEDFVSQRTLLSTEYLGSGSVIGRNGASSLAIITEWLRLRSVGVLFHRPSLCVLVHAPADQEDVLGKQAEGSDMVTPRLQYILFRPSDAFPTWSLAPVTVPGSSDNDGVLPRMGATVIHRIFGLNYERLLPDKALNNTSKHYFFLAFPPTARHEVSFLTRWLRSCNPECHISSSLHPGHWRSFSKLNQGTVIIYGEAMWSVRLFPDLHFLLDSPASNFQFRLFSKSLQQSSLYPLTSESSSTSSLQFQQICEPRRVIMMPPSFLVSQPQQAWSFFKWFFKAWNVDNDTTRLVVCAGFDSWLGDLAAEKSAKWSRIQTMSSAKKQRQEAVHKEGIEALYKSLTVVRTLIDTSSEEKPAFIFAPESIDGNDEQSLVNWFGWWSVMNMDQFRRFCVLGSSETDPRRLVRHFERPKFLLSTFANPDDVYGMRDRTESWTAQQFERRVVEKTRSSLGSGVDAQYLKSRLVELDDQSKQAKWTPQILYRFPVSYWNSGMAFDFGDYHNAYVTYVKCLQFVGNTIHPPSKHSIYNTVLALFYTTEGNWSPDGNPADFDKTRRPWIMIYRPVDPHLGRSNWKATELLIWDPCRKAKLAEGVSVYESDLIEAQRRLIQAVREQLDEKMPLRKVWIGGLDGTAKDLADPVDLAFHQLESFMKNLKIFVPAPERTLPASGWKLIEPGDAPITSRPFVAEPVDIDAAEDEDQAIEAYDAEIKTVFHPPRAKSSFRRPTNCKNRLYQHVSRETGRGQPRESMEYKFRPTMEWYGEQVEEGRGFEHIRVTTWEAIFERLKIVDPKGP